MSGSRPPLVVRRVDAVPVSLPLRKPMRMAGVRIAAADNLLVRVEAEGGLVGWGEAASAPTMTGDLREGMVAAVRDHLAPLVVGQDALEHARLGRLCRQALHGSNGAKSALDMALLDLCGKHLGVPVCDLLGGALRKSVRPMFLLGNATVEEDIAEARAKVTQGIRFFKLKIGIKPIAAEIAATRAVREALGPEVTLCADANMGLTLPQARQYAAAVADCNLLFLEQPLRDDDLQGMATLARQGAIPLCADESIGGTGDILACHAAGASAGVNLKTIKAGGLSATVQAAHVCEALGMEVNLACKVAESSLGAAALCHVGAVIARLDWGVSVTHHYLEADIARTPLAWRGGDLQVPMGPGLGIEVDEAQVERVRAG